MLNPSMEIMRGYADRKTYLVATNATLARDFRVIALIDLAMVCMVCGMYMVCVVYVCVFVFFCVIVFSALFCVS